MRINGFTLVELAIVITIIGLLIGGVLKGQELLENSRMTAVGRDIKSYQAALTTFRDIYKGLPGDIATATSYVTGCTAGNNCANGDGSGFINSNGTHDTYWYYGFEVTEPFQAWKQMALAGLIQGIDTSTADSATRQGGKHVPQTPMGGMYEVKSARGTAAGNDTLMTSGVVIYMTGNNYGCCSATVLSPAQAQKLDLKLDDGIALTGDALAVSNSWTSGCGTTANGTTGYNVNTGGRPCEMGFNVKP